MGITAKGLGYTYPGEKQPVIDDVSFVVADGNMTAIIGANGVGKSTLIKTMLGICKGKGDVWIDGKDKKDMKHEELYRLVGYMTQENALLSNLSVLDVVLLGRLGTLNIRVQDTDVEKAYGMIKLLHLEPYAQRSFYALSGGQRRMVDVAQTLVKEPKVLVMDEPTANLDLVNELQVLELVKAYTKQKNVATLLILHDLNLAARYCDQLVLLKDGKVFASGTPNEVVKEETIEQAYGVRVHVHISSRTGTPMVMPLTAVDKVEYKF